MLINNMYYFKNVVGNRQRLGNIDQRISNYFLDSHTFVIDTVGNNRYTIKTDGKLLFIVVKSDAQIEIKILCENVAKYSDSDSENIGEPIININKNEGKIIVQCLGTKDDIIFIDDKRIGNNHILKDNGLERIDEQGTGINRIIYNENRYITKDITPYEFILATIVAILKKISL